MNSDAYIYSQIKAGSPGQRELVTHCPWSSTCLGTGHSTRDTVFLVPSKAPGLKHHLDLPCVNLPLVRSSTRFWAHDTWIISSLLYPLSHVSNQIIFIWVRKAAYSHMKSLKSILKDLRNYEKFGLEIFSLNSSSPTFVFQYDKYYELCLQPGDEVSQRPQPCHTIRQVSHESCHVQLKAYKVMLTKSRDIKY